MNQYITGNRIHLSNMVTTTAAIIGQRLFRKKVMTSIITVISLSLNGTPFAEPDKVLTLNRTTKPPLSTAEQNGFVDRVATQALAAAGWKMKTLVLPAERALLDANSGVIDGELARVAGIEKAYKNLLPITEKLMDVEFVAFSLKHKNLPEGWKGLENASVAFLNGWKILEKNVPKNADITKVKDPKQLFDLLRLHRVDYIIYEKWAGIDLARSLKIDSINVLSPPLATRPLQMYLNKKHESLVEPITLSLKQLKANGAYQKIYKDTLDAFINNE